ncbi:MAG: carboxypeptidase regulatory-like domain-containing protein, partial [Acidobacteriota bacterium]
MKYLFMRLPTLLLASIVGLFAASTVFGTATIVIQNNDAPCVGFNDPTPATPVGGNNGTTVGAQRLIAFQAAANIWGATLTSGPIITIRASWVPLACTSFAGTLGSTGATSLHSNFANAPFTGFWYSGALANALAGSDLDSGTAEMNARFNVNVGTPGCFQSSHWYYGLDNNHGSDFDLVTVLLHEFGHGLGFSSFTNEANGAQAGNPPGLPSIFDKFLLDNTTGKTWPNMTNAERQASAINNTNLVWNGTQVTNDAVAPVLTSGKDPQGHPLMYAPNPIKAGSSVSHWDISASPNQLMEPNLSLSLTHNVTTPSDLTSSLLRDIGWCFGCSQPPPPPPPSPTPTPSPPPNDNFANAQVISGCSGSVTGSNLDSTHECGEPTHVPGVGNRSVWYSWQAPSTGSATEDRCFMLRSGAVRLLVSVLLCTPTIAFSQQFRGTVLGTIRDPTGAVIPRAQVTLTELATNATVATETDGEGFYAIEYL